MKDIIKFDDFIKVDLRVGKVVEANSPSWSEKLIEFKVDFGEDIGQKIVLSGVKKWYKPGEFVGNNYVFVVNLMERKMGESVSQGMMLMACEEEIPKVFSLPKEIAPGTQLC